MCLAWLLLSYENLSQRAKFITNGCIHPNESMNAIKAHCERKMVVEKLLYMEKVQLVERENNGYGGKKMTEQCWYRLKQRKRL